MKKKLILILLTAILALSLAGCARNVKDFPDYSYTNPELEHDDWTILDYDSDMSVDGVLNENGYKNKNTLDFTAGYSNEVNISVTAYLGTKGVFIGATIQEDYLFYVPERVVYNNTSIEFHISATDAQELTTDVIQLRYGLNGYTEQWIGRHYNGYDYVRHYVPNTSKITIDGEINTFKEGQGWIIEAFVPYSSFGLSGKPTDLRIGPAYNHVRNTNVSNIERMHTEAPDMNYVNPQTFAVFGANGYDEDASTVKKGYLFGSGNQAHGITTGWDVTNDTEAAANAGTTTIVNKGAREQYIYANNYESNKFYLEAEITFNEVFLADGFPKFGLTFRNTSNASIFYIDGQKNQTNKGVGVLEEYSNGEYRWAGNEKSFSVNISYTNGEYTKLAVIRDGADVYYLVNGVLVLKSSNIRAIGADDETVVGLFAFNTGAEFKNIKFIDGTAPEGSTEIDELIAGTAITIAEKIIDADLSDWANNTEHMIKVRDGANTGKSLDVMAFLGTDGLYIAYDAYHTVYITDAPEWFNNTNAEMFINGTNQRYVTATEAKSSVPGGTFAINTVAPESGATLFHTTVEIFIPFAAIPGYNANDNYVTAGFAFKTVGDDITKGHAEFSSGGNQTDNWWFPLGHAPNNPAQQYFITANGLLDTLPVEPTMTIDGNLTDWSGMAEYNVNMSVVRDNASTGKGFTVRAFLDDKGLHIAYEANHALYKTTENDWFNNTNCELQLFGANQLYMAANGAKSLGGGIGAMVTTGGENGALYKTTAEIFLPYAVLRTLGYEDTDGFVRIGFAFKTGGDNITKGGEYSSGLDNSDWWWALNHAPNTAAEQYFVTADGIFADNPNA